MPNQTCRANMEGSLRDSFEDGDVTLDWVWDGTAGTPPGCIGPVTFLRARNLSASTKYGVFTGKKGTQVVITMPPGYDNTLSTRNQCRQAGFNDNTDCMGASAYRTLGEVPAG